MSAAERHVRASIGFNGGQVLAVRVQGDALASLRAAVGGDTRVFELALEDGSVTLDLRQIAYVRVESDDQRVGFGA
ncbi:MAG TPA: hypothetical protein VHX66_01580 [Solirubrobacteraceae bacterium]|jgi:hypothetical protein|nr:hypothetical protein [Solirubrobacteraceae bacterium]